MRRRRSARSSRPDWRSIHERRHPLAGPSWFWGNPGPARREVDGGRRWRRVLAAGVGVLEIALIGALLLGPLFKVRDVGVRGTHSLSSDQVLALAGLGSSGSIFAVDPGAVERRLGASPWIRTASVSAGLPDRVTIQVEEWQPAAVYQPGGGRSWYLSDQAVALGPVEQGADTGGLVEIKGPSGKPSPGQQVLDVKLLVALANIQRALPDILGQQVSSFQLDSCGNLTMTAGRGWKAQFGRVLTPEEFASLKEKVAALKAVSARVNYDNPDLDYVNVMNPGQVAVMTRSAERSLSAAARPSPTPTPASTPAPGPSPGPSPTPAAPAGPVVITPTPGGPISTVPACR
jgi:cell division septal protein FtsQ